MGQMNAEIRMSSYKSEGKLRSHYESTVDNETNMIGGILNEDYVQVELRPYKYMTGGHSYVLEVSRSAICKNYRQRESEFYKNMPEELTPFTPQYLGEINVVVHNEDDHKFFVSNIPRSMIVQCMFLERQRRDRKDARKNSDVSTVSNIDVMKYCTKKDNSSRNDIELEEWSNVCLERYNRAAGAWENKQSKKFIVMENLMCGYDCPSIIDIKLGKSPQTDNTMSSPNNDDLDKKLRFRIDGYKKFDVTTRRYCVSNKNTTRNFNMEQVIEEIGNFFHDGRRMRTDIILRIVNKLDELLNNLGQMKKWTFQAASLLLMYDNSNKLHSDFEVNENCTTVNFPENYTCTSSNNVYRSTSNNRMHDRCLTAVTMEKDQQQHINGCSRVFPDCACVTFQKHPEQLHHTKADVKLIDFLKTDVIDKHSNGAALMIDSEVLKLKKILMKIHARAEL